MQQATAAVVVSISPKGTSPQPTSGSSSLASSSGTSSSGFDYSDSNTDESALRGGEGLPFSRATLPAQYTAVPFTQFAFSTAPPSVSAIEETEAQGTAPLIPSTSMISEKRLAPHFDVPSIKVEVDENEEGAQLLYNVSASYPDKAHGPITFKLQAGDGTLFSVDKDSGRVTLLKALDAEGDQRNYMLQIGTAEAEDTEHVCLCY